MITIDWGKLAAYKASKNKSFEQLCYQLASRLYHKRGHFWPIDDSGGGDGVEFYLTLATKKEWGWQAKFYDGNVRLTASRKQEIIKSLQNSLKVHPNLSHWFLCTNSDLTPTERKWFNTELKRKIPKGRTVTIKHWGHTVLHTFLGQPECIGIKNLFFNQLELSQQWFNSKFKSSYQFVENRYDAEVHTVDSETNYWYIAPHLVTEVFQSRITGLLEELKEKCQEFNAELEKIATLNLKHIQCERERPKIISMLEKIKKEFATIEENLESLTKFLTPNNIHVVWEFEPDVVIKRLDEKHDQAKQAINSCKFEFVIGYAPNEHGDRERLLKVKSSIYSPLYYVERVKTDLRDFISHSRIAERKYTHLLAAAGKGKTHLAVTIAKEYIDSNQPAVFIPAAKFNDQAPIKSQILDLLDIRSGYSFDDLLSTLDAVGALHNKRVPIVIDGLNESVTTQGLFNQRLAQELQGLVDGISAFNNIALFTTCRSSYREALWKRGAEPDGVKEIYGFENPADIKLLVSKYFNKYHVVGEHSYFSLRQFSTPLLLKIFCEVHQGKPESPTHVVIGLESIYETFQLFVARCDERIFDLLHQYYGPLQELKTVVATSLPVLANDIWNSRRRWITYETFTTVVDNGKQVEYLKSKSKAVLDQELLFMMDWGSTGQTIRFTYDLFAGYTVAEQLIELHKHDVNSFLMGSEFKSLCEKDPKNQEPFHEDILECLAALLPVKTGIHLCDALPKAFVYEPGVMASIRALFSLAPKYVGEHQTAFIIRLFERPGNRKAIIDMAEHTFFSPDHPLNIRLWARLLANVSVFERDMLWAHRIASQSLDNDLELLEEFDKNCRSKNTLSTVLKSKTDLVATYLALSLSTTIGKFRQHIINSLYTYGLNYTDEYIELFKQFASYNDPQIVEQISRCTYSLVLTKHIENSDSNFMDKKLPLLIQFIFANFYQGNAEYSTTHVLIRDHTINIILIGIRHHPNVLTEEQIEQIYPPFKKGGIRKWGRSKDKDKKKYYDGNALVDYYFEKEKMPDLASGDSFNPSKEYLAALSKLRWRAYALGYEFKVVGEIDRHIARQKDSRNPYWQSTEKYGEKYINIAYHELLGFSYDEQGVDAIRLFIPEDEDDLPPVSPRNDPPFIKTNYIGGAQSIKRWVSDGRIPSVDEYTQIEKIETLTGPWILLSQQVDQYDEKSGRNFFMSIHAFLFNRTEFEANKDLILNSKFHFEIPQQHNLFDLEIPDSAMFKYNGIHPKEVEIDSSIEVAKVIQKRLTKNNKPLTDAQEDVIWKAIRKKFGVDVYRMDSEEGSIFVNLTPLPSDSSRTKTLKKNILSELKGLGVKILDVPASNAQTRPVFKQIQFLSPVTKTRSRLTLAKELSEEMNLVSKVGDQNLFQRPSGSQASIYLSTPGNGYHNYQSHLFIRKQLLDDFISKNDLIMIWKIFGERQYLVAPERREVIGLNPHWINFNKSIEYKP